jgi:hypothetical protein
MWQRFPVCLLLLSALAGEACTSCRTTILAEVPAPTSEWRAGLIAVSCGSAHGLAVNLATNDQDLVRPGSAENTALNLGLPCCIDPEAPESRDLVTLEWEHDKLLIVTYPQCLQRYAYIGRSEIDDVRITLQAVETWLDEQGCLGEWNRDHGTR